MKYPQELGDVKHWDIETKPCFSEQNMVGGGNPAPPCVVETIWNVLKPPDNWCMISSIHHREGN